jgi:hypothetical protein
MAFENFKIWMSNFMTTNRRTAYRNTRYMEKGINVSERMNAALTAVVREATKPPEMISADTLDHETEELIKEALIFVQIIIGIHKNALGLQWSLAQSEEKVGTSFARVLPYLQPQTRRGLAVFATRFKERARVLRDELRAERVIADDIYREKATLREMDVRSTSLLLGFMLTNARRERWAVIDMKRMQGDVIAKINGLPFAEKRGDIVNYVRSMNELVKQFELLSTKETHALSSEVVNSMRVLQRIEAICSSWVPQKLAELETVGLAPSIRADYVRKLAVLQADIDSLGRFTENELRLPIRVAESAMAQNDRALRIAASGRKAA